MTWTVSIGDLRNNLADYLEKVKQGDDLVVRDEKRNEEIGKIIPKKQFNSANLIKAIDRIAGTISAKDHPEWATIAKTEKWLRKIRLGNMRHFNVHS